MRLVASFAAVALTMSPLIVNADRVPSPPSDCPEGSIGRTSHNGPTCAPTTCGSAADCQRDFPDGARCVSVALCIEEETFVPGGRSPDRTPRTRDVARGPCIDGRCPVGECRAANRCAAGVAEPEPAPTTAPAAAAPAAEDDRGEASSDGGGGCAVHPRPIRGRLALFGLGALVLSLRRSRHRLARRDRAGLHGKVR